MKLVHAKYPLPKTAKEALLTSPKARAQIEAMEPKTREIAMKGIQLKLDQAHAVFNEK